MTLIDLQLLNSFVINSRNNFDQKNLPLMIIIVLYSHFRKEHVVLDYMPPARPAVSGKLRV